MNNNLKKNCKIVEIDVNDPKIHKRIKDIHLSCFEDEVDIPWEDLMWGLIDKDTNQVVGYCAMGFSRYKVQAAFTAAAIIKRYRGFGFQKKMIQHRCRIAKKMGFSRVVTHTVFNPASENSLISCGFKLYRPKVEWAGEHANYWYKTLGV